MVMICGWFLTNTCHSTYAYSYIHQYIIQSPFNVQFATFLSMKPSAQTQKTQRRRRFPGRIWSGTTLQAYTFDSMWSRPGAKEKCVVVAFETIAFQGFHQWYPFFRLLWPENPIYECNGIHFVGCFIGKSHHWIVWCQGVAPLLATLTCLRRGPFCRKLMQLTHSIYCSKRWQISIPWPSQVDVNKTQSTYCLGCVAVSYTIVTYR